MRYEKPMLMEIGARAAAGQGPEACIPGGNAGSIYETCSEGVGAGWSCVPGTGVSSGYGSCVPGDGAGNADCFSGTAVSYYCGAGTAGDADPLGCREGPSFV